MNGLAHTVASVGQIACLGRGAKGRPHEIDRRRDWLCPGGNYSHRIVDLCPVGDESVLLDQVTRELGETKTLSVTVKGRAEDKPEPAIGVRGRSPRPMLQADVHHAAQVQARQMNVGIAGGGY